jgi:antirestriction protein ArdC
MAFDVYQMVTDKIVAVLGEKRIPWHKPWQAIDNQNYESKHRYSGINFLLLQCSEFKSPFWITFKGVQKYKDAKIKKGEYSTQVVFWRMVKGEKTDKRGVKTPTTFPLLRYYNVFNWEQTEGLKDKMPEFVLKAHSPIAEIDATIQVWLSEKRCAPIEWGSNKACYIPDKDVIYMPEKGLFDNEHQYYATIFHEIVHSTKGDNRSGRTKDKGYAFEELVAEIGASFLCHRFGIPEKTIENTKAYCQSWAEKLKNDPKMVVYAAGKAEKAVSYLLGEKENKEEVVAEVA